MPSLFRFLVVAGIMGAVVFGGTPAELAAARDIETRYLGI